MSPERQTQTGITRRHPAPTVRLAIGVAAVLFPAIVGHAQYVEEEALERSMTFVELSNEAAELFNEQRLEEAAAILQTLAADFGDLDDNGFVAMGLGDSLAGLGRVEEARAVYLRALATHPDLQASIEQRLVELDLLGPVNASLLDRLRAAARSGGEGANTAARQLGRALAQRARDLLAEAVETLRSIEPESILCRDSRWLLTDQAALLDDLEQDLAFINQRLEQFGLFRLMRLSDADLHEKPSPPDIAMESQHVRQMLRAQDGRRIEIELSQPGEGDCLQIVINGQPVSLTDVQRRLLQRHQERINAILLDAADGSANRPVIHESRDGHEE
jgi:tetratricopeptide (TPR) repeat protein